MRLDEVLTILNNVAPFDTAEQWDNVGLMVGDPASEVTSIVVALDPSFDVINCAIEQKADCIITHHPLFFTPVRCMNLRESTAKKVSVLMKSDMSLVSMHTNLDMACGGVADVLADRLGLRDIQNRGALRTGTVGGGPSLSMWAGALPFGDIRIVDAGRTVRNVCVCPGSGMDYWRDAHDMGSDTFVTGDVKYHAALDAKEAGLNVIDLGHHGTEEIIVKPLTEKLQQELPEVYIRAYESRDVFTCVKGE